VWRRPARFSSSSVAAATGLSVQAARIAEQRDRAEAQRARAERETAKARAINDFLLRTLGAANPQSGTGREVTLVAALETAASTARHALAADPEVEAGVLNVVGMTYVELGRYDDAAPLLDRALLLRTKALGDRHVDVAESLESKATLLRWRGQFEEAERLYRDALTIVRAAGGLADRIAWILQGLGLSYSQRGDDQTALTIFGEGLELARSGPVSERTRAELLGSAGVSHRRLEHYEQAEASYREALAIERRLLGPEHAEVGTLLNNLGVLMNSSGRYAEAESIHRDALKVRQTALGANHPLVANSMLNLAVSLENRGDMSGAGASYEQAARIVRAALGPDHPRLAQILRNWGVMLGNQQRFAEAVPLLREALRIRRTAFKGGQPRCGGRVGRAGCYSETLRFVSGERNAHTPRADHQHQNAGTGH
jgi:tetratricopeptide (TPR) repeat protein